MPRRAASSQATPTESPADRLQTAVDELADNVRVLTDVVDQIREDLSWLTRNGVPHQPLIVHVQRMPLLTNLKPSGSFEFSLLAPEVRDPTAETLSDDNVRAIAIDQIVSQLADPLGQLAQEQLNTLLSVLDDSHRMILRAIREPATVESTEVLAPPPRKRRPKKPAATSPSPTPPADPPPPPGQLF